MSSLTAALGSTLLSVPSTDSISDLLARAGRGGRYEAPRREELARARGLFERTLWRRESLSVLESEWAALGFELRRAGEGPEASLVLAEAPRRKLGRGFYLFRDGPSAEIALEAPHAPSDLYTGEIALALYREAPFLAAAWSTVHRRQADLAHLSESYFGAFTLAVGAVCPRAAIIQLHGFETGRRLSRDAGGAAVIVSGGTLEPGRRLRRVAECLERPFPDLVKLFPRDVGELGGTRNVQARALRRAGHEGFVHLEMSVAFRRRLRDDAETRKMLAACLTGE